ncbi:Polyphenol oxidase, chloroplastic [Linum grandiflorum]
MTSSFSPVTGAVSGPHYSLNQSLHTNPKFPQLSAFRSKTHSRRHVIKISCNASNDKKAPTTRRDLLIGMGGLYGVGSSSDPAAFAAPVPPPDLTKCTVTSVGPESVQCCPPFNGQHKIIDFKLPSSRERVRIRPAAHLVNKSYIAKYERAIQLMKALPDDDPRSFKQQANIHCAYCNGAYIQTGFPDARFEVHSSWLFFPFHRFYLHFFERILGKLIDDPSFALPYWNWDNPPGMTIPSFFMNPNSPLHDPIRNPDHQESVLLDMDWNDEVDSSSPEEQYKTNLSLMHTQMVTGASKASLFFGSALKAGDNVTQMSSQGTIEATPHGIVHVWMGDWTNQPNGENMGTLYSAARDPIFYSHHANVDRMWNLWKTAGPNRKDISDPDWLESAFVFYDEDKNLVRCKIKDCVDSRKQLKYDYQQLKTTTTPKATRRPVASAFGAEKSANAAGHRSRKKRELTPMSEFPLVLNKSISVMVPRPKKSRNASEKEDEEEVVVVEGIELDLGKVVKFDVAINDEDDGAPAGPQDTEFAGTFVNVPHKKKSGGASTCKTSMRLGITSLLDDLDVDGDDTIIVTLTPKVGEVKIGGVKIDYITE